MASISERLNFRRPVGRSERYVVYGLNEIYHEFGSYEFKIVLNEKYFKSSLGCDLTIMDSDRNPVRFELSRWGRKMRVTFSIDENVADGISTIDISLMNKSGKITEDRLFFWTIKP